MKAEITPEAVRRVAFHLILVGLASMNSAGRDPHVFPWRLTPSIDEPDLGMLDDEIDWDAFAIEERLRTYYRANVKKPADPSKIIYPEFPTA